MNYNSKPLKIEDFLNNTYDKERFDKSKLREEEQNLDRLYEHLLHAFEYLEIVRGTQSVIAFGNTGCGKSTMFNALINGAESLEPRKEMREIEVPVGGKLVKKMRPRQIIDLK